jgi:hypothetical protein
MVSTKYLYGAILRPIMLFAFFIDGYRWIHGPPLSIIAEDNVKADYLPDARQSSLPTIIVSMDGCCCILCTTN